MEKIQATDVQTLYEEGTLPPRIEHAFKDSSYPGDECLMRYPSHWECAEIAQAFAGQHWKAVPLELLGDHQESLLYFTPEAYRYYLPAYLLASLRRLSASEVKTRIADIPSTLIYTLTPPKYEQYDSDDFQARMRGLTLEQKAVIRDFLRWSEQSTREWEQECLPEHVRGRREEDEDIVALKGYWENGKLRLPRRRR